MKTSLSGNSQKVLQEHPWLWAIHSGGWHKKTLKVKRVDCFKLSEEFMIDSGKWLSVWALFLNDDIPGQADHRVKCICQQVIVCDPQGWARVILNVMNRHRNEWKIKYIAIERGLNPLVLDKNEEPQGESTIVVCKPMKGLTFDLVLNPVIENSDGCVTLAQRKREAGE